jgi:iron complex outermembrane receptor protein
MDDWGLEAQFSYYFARSKSTLVLLPPGAVLPVGNDGNIFTPHEGDGCVTVNIPDIGCLTTFSEGFIGTPGNESIIPKLDLITHYTGWKEHQIRLNIGIKKEEVKSFETKNFGPGVLDSTTLAGKQNPTTVDGSLIDVTGTSSVYLPNKSRIIKYLSLQDIWKINPSLTLTSGMRFDNYDDFGNTINPRLALVWSTSDRLITKLLYSEAYRAPSFSDLYVKNNPVIMGNKNLTPEEIKTTELSFNYTVNKTLNVNLNVYQYQTTNMIETVTRLEGGAQIQNNKNLTGQGFDLETSWQPIDNFKLSANYAYQSTKNDINNKQVEYVPQNQVYFDARWQINSNWKLSTQLSWLMNRERSIGDLRDSIDDYKRVNATLRRSNIGWGKYNKNFEFSISLKNLFGEDIYEPSDGKIVNDYLMHGRRIYAELSYKL